MCGIFGYKGTSLDYRGYDSWGVGVVFDNKELLNEGRLDVRQSFTNNKEYLAKCYEYRVISQKLLPINYDTYIYNDVFAFYYYFAGEVFGVEIHNVKITYSQRKIFEILWRMAKVEKF